MDQTKIGKLIAKLRKEKGMTQRELGDKVGVGFKAVSKWERGITCPDISIINELSKILGITSDELLTGELSKEHQTKHSRKINQKIFKIIPIVILIIFTIFIIFKINNNYTDVYNLNSKNNEYYIEGKVIFNTNNTISLNINKLVFRDKELNKTTIKNYTYKIDSNNTDIIVYGYLLNINELHEPVKIKDIMNDFNINYEGVNYISKKELIKNGLVLKITFIDSSDNLIESNIELSLDK